MFHKLVDTANDRTITIIRLIFGIVFFELIIDPACSMAFEAEPGEPGDHAKKTAS